jgi:PmbA protein
MKTTHAAPTPFFYDAQGLEALNHKMLQMARELGATDAATEVSESSGLSVTVRMGALETLEHTRDRGASVTVYIGQRRGHATTSDLSDTALQDAVKKALDIAKYTAEDPYAGLPDEADIARGPHRSLDLFYPWSVSPDQATQMAKEAEAAARAVDRRIRNSDGASVSASHGQFCSANSRGFMGGYPYSRHFLSVAPIAQEKAVMQRDDWYTTSRNPVELAPPKDIGVYAAKRALSRLNARRLETQQIPVIFEAPIAVGLIGSLVQALSGSALYRKASFLLDSMGQEIFSKDINLIEDPFLPGASGSTPFDDEGVRVRQRKVIDAGRVAGYFLSTYSARKLAMPTTGNAGGSHNLSLTSSKKSPNGGLTGLLKLMGRGILVTEVMGQGVNPITGDYSRGAFGYWVENGEIQYPVEEFTIAGNLKEMYRGLTAVGGDTLTRGNKTTGSLLIDRMTIAGC